MKVKDHLMIYKVIKQLIMKFKAKTSVRGMNKHKWNKMRSNQNWIIKKLLKGIKIWKNYKMTRMRK